MFKREELGCATSRIRMSSHTGKIFSMQRISCAICATLSSRIFITQSDKIFAPLSRNFHYDNIEQFYFQWFLPRVAPFHRIETHAIEYAQKGVPISAEMRIFMPIRSREFQRLILRLGFDCDVERIRRVVDDHKIETMKRAQLAFDVEIAPEHFRKGGWGNFREDMPSTVRKDVETRFASVIEQWGYDRGFQTT